MNDLPAYVQDANITMYADDTNLNQAIRTSQQLKEELFPAFSKVCKRLEINKRSLNTGGGWGLCFWGFWPIGDGFGVGMDHPLGSLGVYLTWELVQTIHTFLSFFFNNLVGVGDLH